DALAVFHPYNRHFLHDAGAFEVGLGVTVLMALRWRDALVVVLTGISVASWLHVLAHALDRNIGGRPGTDIPGLVLLAALATAAALRVATATAAAGDQPSRRRGARVHEAELRSVEGRLHVRWAGGHGAATHRAIERALQAGRGPVRQVEWGAYELVLCGDDAR